MSALSSFLGSYSYLIFLVVQNAVLALSVYATLMAGQLSLACMGFMSIGAYGSALLAVNAGLPYPLSLVCAALVSGGFAMLIGTPILR